VEGCMYLLANMLRVYRDIASSLKIGRVCSV
jgi:hypothetical protein